MNQRPVTTRLVIPTTQSSPNSQLTTPNGRPSAWSWSAQRKMIRLYLYTTLPADKIRAIVNAHSPDKTIKQSSANKKLQSFFDKEPRWLHPHDNKDMGRRITELANSPTQLHKAWEVHHSSAHLSSTQDRASPYGRRRSSSDFLGIGASPSDACSESIYSSDAFSESQMSLSYAAPEVPGESPGESRRSRDRSVDDSQDLTPFIPFLARTTFMTESSARTTGTFRHHLQGFAEPYIEVVKRLVKRYTSPALDQSSSSSSSHDKRVDPSHDWIGGELAESGRPRARETALILPGTFVSFESLDFANNSGILVAWRHWCGCVENRSKICWLMPDGLTALAGAVLNLLSTQFDDMPCDCFSNTALHFLAACAMPQVLCRALIEGQCSRIINAQNTAGQTFMHLLNPSNGWDQQSILRLIDIAQHKGFDMSARDCLGQSGLHVLKKLDMLPYGWSDFSRNEFHVRDGFGCVPVSHELNPSHRPTFQHEHALPENESFPMPDHPALNPEESNNPEISHESQLLQNIRMSLSRPHWEDQYGHNGLHCLAMATLSLGSLAEKHGMREEAEQVFAPQSFRHSSDSSTERLKLRLSLLESLLATGQDPNHRDKFGQTPLMAFVAALPEDGGYKVGPEILKCLIAKGAQVNARNRAGETALHVAVRFHRKLAIRVLAEAGANVHVTDACGRSLLAVCDEELAKDGNPSYYGKYSACRAVLSGQAGAVQDPFFLRQWMVGS